MLGEDGKQQLQTKFNLSYGLWAKMSGCHAFKGHLMTHLQGRAWGACGYVQNRFSNFKCILLKISQKTNLQCLRKNII